MRLSRAQSTLEYAVIIGVVISALLAMQVYIRRGIQSQLKGGADAIGSQYAATDTDSRSYYVRNVTGGENLIDGDYTSDVYEESFSYQGSRSPAFQ